MADGPVPGLLSPPTVEEIRAEACAAAFGEPLISNFYRELVAEIIVGAALGPEWRLCSGDWRGWDFEHPTGCRLEVKQSAARQTWTGERKVTVSIFDIRARTGYFEGADWVADPRRFAHICVIAHHPLTDASADHRFPDLCSTIDTPLTAATAAYARARTGWWMSFHIGRRRTLVLGGRDGPVGYEPN